MYSLDMVDVFPIMCFSLVFSSVKIKEASILSLRHIATHLLRKGIFLLSKVKV